VSDGFKKCVLTIQKITVIGGLRSDVTWKQAIELCLLFLVDFLVLSSLLCLKVIHTHIVYLHWSYISCKESLFSNI